MGKSPTLSGWWYTYPSEKYLSNGSMTPKYSQYSIWKKMFQTTNQFCRSNMKRGILGAQPLFMCAKALAGTAPKAFLTGFGCCDRKGILQKKPGSSTLECF